MNTFEKMTRNEFYNFVQSVVPYLTITKIQLSREADVSYSLTHMFFHGSNKNERILKVLLNHLDNGWQDAIDPQYMPLVLSYIDQVPEPENGVSAVGVSAS